MPCQCSSCLTIHDWAAMLYIAAGHESKNEETVLVMLQS